MTLGPLAPSRPVMHQHRATHDQRQIRMALPSRRRALRAGRAFAGRRAQRMMLVVDELKDFLCQMEIAVLEESPLYEIPRGSIYLVTPPVEHGPWPAATCAAVLRLWHTARLDRSIPSQISPRVEHRRR